MRNRSLDGRVCESFYAKDVILANMMLKKISGMAELRYDLSHLSPEDIRSLKKTNPHKFIFTCRGGVFSDERNWEAYRVAIASGYDYIDIDLAQDGHLLAGLQPLLLASSTQLILSYHNYHETPKIQELELIIKKLASSQPDLIKIATQTRLPEDVDLLMKIQKKFNKTICLGMGRYATESRIKSLKNGGAFTFVAFDTSKSTAQGQLNYKDFDLAYTHFRGGEILKLAVLGNPISHSKSPNLFQDFFRQDGIEGVYEKIELEQISEFNTLKLVYDGFSVTSPFKQSIIPFLDDLSVAARKIGAVNTVYQKNGKWLGDNTDYIGIGQSIELNAGFSNINSCLIMGAGGAARAAAYTMESKGIATVICNRTHSKAQELARKFSIQSSENRDPSSFDLIINTIPYPMSLIDFRKVHAGQIILDAIYPISHFSSLKETKGFKMIAGEVWLMEQAKAAYVLFRR